MLQFDPRTGCLEVRTPLFSTARGEVSAQLGGPGFCALRGPWRRTGRCFELKTHGLSFRLSVETPSRREARVRLDASRSGGENVRVDGLIALNLPAASTKWAADPDRVLHYVHNTALGEPHGVKLLTRDAGWAGPFAKSSAVTVLYDPEKRRALLIGVLPDASSYTVLQPMPAAPEGRGAGWTVSCDIRAELKPRHAFTTGTILLLSGADPHDLLEEYGDLWAKLRPPTRKPVRVGWNSWDYYSGSVRRSDMDENLDAARAAFGGDLKTWVIDEGWEAQWGAWIPNPKFPEGMADYCKRVRDAGCEPGIWTAPLCMNVYTPHSRYHQGWFARDARGQPVLEIMAYGYIGFLDPTRDDVCCWLGETFGRLRKAGFSYYKLDFLSLLNKAHHFQDPTVPRAQAFQRAVQAIRKAVGPEAYVLSTPDMEAFGGLLDAARIGGDIHNFWGHIRQNAISAAVHYWKHGRLWNNDPDFAIIRCAELSGDPHLNRPYERRPLGNDYWFAGPEANLEECRTWLNIVCLSAGEMILGDRIGKLSPQGIQMLRRALPRLPAPARPLDLFSDQSPPARWRAKTAEGWLLGCFNWKDFPVTMPVSCKDWGGEAVALKDFWSGKTLPEEPLLHLPAHHSRLIRVIRR